MTIAKGWDCVFLFVIFHILVVSESSQDLQRDVQQLFSPQSSRAAAMQDERAAEQSLWDSIKDGSDPQSYKTFLMKYPQGQFGSEARSRLVMLLGEDYVSLFMKRVNLNRQWSNMEKQLGRRADVIPQLISSLQEAGVQEPELFGQIAESRAHLLNAMHAAPQGDEDYQTPEQKRVVIDADNGFGKALRKLDSLSENYPQLRSNERFLRVQDEIAGTENRTNVARMDYNNAAQDYNNARREPRMAAAAERYKFTEEPYIKSEQGQPVEPRINSDHPL